MQDKNEFTCEKCGTHDEPISHGNRCECRKCGKYQNKKVTPGVITFKENGNKAFVQLSIEREIVSLDDLIETCKIDTSIWMVDRWTQGNQKAYRKDRYVNWEVEDGKVLKGIVRDSGKLLIKSLFTVKAWLVRRTEEIRAEILRDLILKDLRKASKPVKLIKIKNSGGYLLEFDFPDMHFGKQTWAEESTHDYDISIARKMALTALSKLVKYSEGNKIERILFPFGNDFFNSDTIANTTTKGTPQQEDKRWALTFRAGWNLARTMIDTMYQIAPVDIIVMPGNHDTTRTFYLGELLQALYEKNKNITVDNSAKATRYYKYGISMIGFNHGEMKIDRLAGMMPQEEPIMWGQTTHREWHLGHRHRSQKFTTETDTEMGIVFRYLMSLSATDTWHFGNGFIGAKRAAEAFLWHREDGWAANYNATGD